MTDAELANEIFDIHAASQRTYGQPRILGQLHHRGRRVSGKRVARIMAECGLVGVHGRKKWRRGRKAGVAPGPDLISRDLPQPRTSAGWISPSSSVATASCTSLACSTCTTGAGRLVNGNPSHG